MSNPFEQLNISDDQEQAKVIQVKAQEKLKRTHQQKKLFKKSQQESNNNISQPASNEPTAERIKQSHTHPFMERNKKEYKAKELTSGHYHDRQSGTGRQDRPRKAGGGYGNVGNVKDQQNRQKYVKDNEEVKPETATQVQAEVPVAEEKAPEPEKLTLQEYYKAKGVDLAYNAQSRAPVKRSDINADWIKKEKLILVQTKQDLKNQQRNNQQALKRNEGKAGLDIDQADFGKLGFGAKLAAKQQPRQHEQHRKGAKKNNKPAFSTEDFPTL